MALDFPASPTSGQTYTGPGGVIWVWDGAKWINGTGITTAYAPIDSPALTGNPTAPNPAAGDADTSVATTQFVAAAVGTALHDVGRNLLHNPLFNVAQRGAGPWTTAGSYTADRWLMNLGGSTMSSLISPMTDADRAAVSDEAAVSALQSAVTGTAGTNDYAMVAQRIEGVRRLSGKTVTLSFWARASSGTPKIGYELYQSFGGGGSPSADVSGIGSGATAALSATWTRYTATIAVPSTAGKTLGTNNNDWMGLHFWLSAGATLNARAGGIGVQSGTFLVWGVQLEIGSVATPLEKPDPQQDLAKCQRFFQYYLAFGVQGYGAAGMALYTAYTFPPMRAQPTATPVGTVYGNASGLTFSTITTNYLNPNITVTAAAWAYSSFNLQLSADL